MTDTPVREIVAEALYDQGDSAGAGYRWDEQPDRVQVFYRRQADAVLAAVEPVIRQQVAEEIAEGIAAYRPPSTIGGEFRSGLIRAAAIARSHTEEET